jgi:hypothetical protein
MRRRQLPTAVLVLAIFHFILGGYGLLCGLCSGVTVLTGGNTAALFSFGNPQLAQQQQAQQEAMQRVLKERVPHLQAYQAVTVVVSLALSAALIVAGMGLLYLRGWARALSLLYALFSILQTLLTAFYSFVYVTPATEEAFRQMPNMDPQQAHVMQSVGPMMLPLMVVGVLIQLVYPVTVLIIMLLPSVRAAFRGEPVPGGPEEPEDYRDPGPPRGFDDTDDRLRTGER